MTSHPLGFFEGTEMPTEGWWEALFPDPAAIVSKLGVSPGGSAIDLCCGNGWFTLPMATIAKRVFAVDIDSALLDDCRAGIEGDAITNVVVIEGDAYDVANLVTEPVDVVVMANCFHGVPNRTRLAREIAAVLTPSGRFAILNWHRRPREETPVLGEPRGPPTELRMSPEETAEAVLPGGFNSVGVVEMPPYHYGALFRRR